MEALERVRLEGGKVEAKLRRRSVHRAAVEAFSREVDEIAGLITGDRTYFHAKPHTMPTAFGAGRGRDEG